MARPKPADACTDGCPDAWIDACTHACQPALSHGDAPPPRRYATTTTVGGKQFVFPGSDPKDATEHVLQDLAPGAYYAVRLVLTNPAGTTIGRPSKPMLTCPAAPPKPIPNPNARSDSIEIMFAPQGQFLTRMKVHASL